MYLATVSEMLISKIILACCFAIADS